MEGNGDSGPTAGTGIKKCSKECEFSGEPDFVKKCMMEKGVLMGGNFLGDAVYCRALETRYPVGADCILHVHKKYLGELSDARK